MKSVFHRTFPVLLAVILMIGLSAPAFGVTVKGEVTYNGSSVKVSDNSAKMKKTLSSMVPGDEVDIVFNMSNKGKNKTDWYVKDDIAKAFEDGAKSTNGAYTYELYYKNSKGKKKVLYSSDTVGGESTSAEAPVGLHQATNSTDEYFYLDRLGSGGTGQFGVKVAIEGETHNNDYQKTLSNIEANFAVQEVASGASSTTSSGTANTGDQTKLMLYIILFIAAGILLICILAYMLIQRRRGGSHE